MEFYAKNTVTEIKPDTGKLSAPPSARRYSADGVECRVGRDELGSGDSEARVLVCVQNHDVFREKNYGLVGQEMDVRSTSIF